MKTFRSFPYVAVILSMLCWSLSFVWIKFAYISYKPITIIFLRLIISVLLLGLFLLIARKFTFPRRSDIKYILLLAFFEPFLYFMGESFGLQYVSSTLGAVFVSTIPLFAPIAGWYFYRERLTVKNFLGILLSFVGVGVVALKPDFSPEASLTGVLLMMVAVFSAVGYATVLKKIADRYNPVVLITYQNIIGIFLFLPFWMVFDLYDFMQTPFDPTAMWAIVKLAIFASSLAFIFFTYSLRHLDISKANTFANVIPVFTAIFAFFILGESLNIQKMTGIAIVISGLFLSQIKPKAQWKISGITLRKSLPKK